MPYKKLLLLASVFVLVGAGCSGGQGVSSATDGGVFQTTTSGQDWMQLTAVPSPKGVGTIAGTDIVSMEMDPQDRNALYIGTRENGMLFSLDGGAAWMQPRYEALNSGMIAAIEVDPKNVCTVYVAKASRVYKTEDCFRSVDAETYVESRVSVSVAQIAVDWYNPEVVWLGLTNGDIVKSENGGETWRTVLNAKKEITALLINNSDSRMVLAGTENDGFYKTTDGGETWGQIEKELKDLKNANKVAALVQDRSGGTVLAATSYGIIRSTDFGTSWTPLTLVTSAGQVAIRALGMDPKKPDVIYYAAGATFYSSTNGGTDWDTQKIPTTRTPQVLLVDPEEPNLVYVAVAAPVKK